MSLRILESPPVLIGDVLAGTASGTIGIVAASGKSDGDVLTIQSDGSVDFETPVGGGGDTLPILDSTAVVKDPADATKLVRIDAGAITTGTTRVITMGDRDVDLASGGTFAELSHTHTASDVTDFSTAADARITAAVLDDLSDVTLGSESAGDLLYYTGTAWQSLAVGGTDGHVLTADGIGGLAWEAAAGGGGGDTLPILDSTAVVKDPADATKLVRIDAGAITTGTTRVITMGDRDVNLASGGTFAELSHTHTASNVTDFATAADARIAAAGLGDLSDVTLGSETAGDLLYYTGTAWQSLALVDTDGHVLTADGAGSMAWEASAGGVSTLSDLTDVDDTLSLSTGDMLYYNGTVVTKLATSGLATHGFIQPFASGSIGLFANPRADVLTVVSTGKYWLEMASHTGTTGDKVTLTFTTGQVAFAGMDIFKFSTDVSLGSRIYQDLTTETDGATVTLDWSTGNQGIVTLGGNRTLAFSNLQTGQRYTLWIKQDGTGTRTLTWPAYMIWDGGSAPTLATTGGNYDCIVFTCLDDTGAAEIVHGALEASDAS